MARVYVEKKTGFKFQGKTFKAGGAVVTPNAIIAYLGKDGKLTNWKGTKIGTYRIVSSWKTPNSFISSHMHQVEAVVKGVKYTGRSAGVGMIFKGKKKAK